MNHLSKGVTIQFLFLLFAACLLLAPGLAAQGGMPSVPIQQPSVSTQVNQRQDMMRVLTEVDKKAGTMVDPLEQAAYSEFYNTKPEDVDKKIKLGQQFLVRYPNSLLVEAVDAGLVNAYYQKQDWNNFYTTADNALALKPDDVDVLTTVGWVIPHVYDAKEPNANERLDKAEKYETKAIDVIGKMSKPDYLSDDQFAVLKSQKLVQAHSALGLVYFRRHDNENSAKELEQATANNPNVDPSDLFILGLDLANLNRKADAIQAFSRCSEIAGGLQDQCKHNLDVLKKQAAAAH